MKTLEYNGNTYHIDKLPVAEGKTKSSTRLKKDDYMLANEKTFIFFKKNIHDFEIANEMRDFFHRIKQPSESKVREAMIIIIDEDYAIKSGGDSKSDHIYSSSFKWMQASPTTGEDIEPVLLKKFSKNFEDVLITLEEIEFLILNSLTEKEKIQKAKNDVESMITFLARTIQRGKYNESFFTTKTKPYTIEFKERVLSKIKNLDKNNYAVDFIESRIEYLNKQADPFINGTNWIVKDSNDFTENNKDEVKTQDEINFYTKLIKIYSELKQEFILLPVLV
jgi:hypothetical protein